jgi:biopolymer transport protein ExbD
MQKGNTEVVEEENEINLTPMLDVVFVMLIFFIVTASFIKETGIDINKPEPAPPKPQDDVSFLVTIDENSDIWIDRRLVDPRALRANIERLHAESPEGSVVIQADERSFNNTLVQVMDASRQAGLYKISLATNKKVK